MCHMLDSFPTTFRDALSGLDTTTPPQDRPQLRGRGIGGEGKCTSGPSKGRVLKCRKIGFRRHHDWAEPQGPDRPRQDKLRGISQSFTTSV